jgi:uncharacterized protein
MAENKGNRQGNSGSSGKRSSSGTSSGRGGSSHRGFAAMDHEKQREIARQGGRSVPDEKRYFSQNRGLAAEAGRKGGESRGSSGGRGTNRDEQ